MKKEQNFKQKMVSLFPVTLMVISLLSGGFFSPTIGHLPTSSKRR